VQLGLQARADRYTYVSLIGVFVAIAWLAGEVVARRPALRTAVVGAAVVLLSVYAAVAALQLTRWQNTMTLFAHAAEVTDRNFVAHYMVGMELAKAGRTAEAAAHYAEAVRAAPNYLDARVNLGAALEVLGDYDAAERHYRAALAIDPTDSDAKANLDALLSRRPGQPPATQPLAPRGAG
jgi:tetratricopeptide (TPR) repeat protein